MASTHTAPPPPPPRLLRGHDDDDTALPPPPPALGDDRPPNSSNAHTGRARSRIDPAEEHRRRVQEYCGHLRLSRDDQPPAFELLVLGCGGGPIETNLSSFLVKPYAHKWTDGCTGLEGGSTIGAVASLVERNPFAFEGFGLQIGVDAHELDLGSPPVTTAVEILGPEGMVGRGQGAGRGALGVGREGGGKAAARVWDLIRCFAITHAHLDHIAGLIISSAACRPPPKPVYGIKRTIANIERLMDGGVWPMLGGWDDSVTLGRAYHYKDVPTKMSTQLPLSPSLSFHAFPLAHGADPSGFHKRKQLPSPHSSPRAGECAGSPEGECYDSTAFFVREEESGRELLFFGDVEPDSISRRGFNLDIWKAAAPKIVDGVLSVIFLECSYPSSQPKDKLFGHFSPPYILEEMVVLADLVRQARLDAGWNADAAAKTPLRDVIVVIQHIKDDIFTFPTPTSDAPPPVPPKEPPPSTSSKPRRSNPPSRSPTLDAPRVPPSSSSPSSATAAYSFPSPSPPEQPAPPLSMGPPVASAPTRRPSSTAFFSTSAPQLGFGFGHGPGPGFGSSRSSPSSHVFSGDFSGFSLGGGALAGSASAGTSPRRVSTPGHFFGSGHGAGGRSSVSPARLSHLPPPPSLPVPTVGAALDEAAVSPLSQPGVGAPPVARAAKEDQQRDEQLAHRLGTFAIAEAEESASSAGGTPVEPEVGVVAQRQEDAREEEQDPDEEEEEMVDETVHERIERELNELEAERGTGVRFLIALQGMRLVF